MPFALSSRAARRRWLAVLLTMAAMGGSPVGSVAARAADGIDPLVPSAPLAQAATEMRQALARPVGANELARGRKALHNEAASDDTVATYLLQADAADVLGRHVLGLVGDERFAGVALDVPGQRIHLFLAGQDFATVSAVLTASLPDVVIVKVDRSLTALRALHRSVDDQFHNLDVQGVKVVTVGEDIPTNKVVVGVISDLAQAERILRQLFPQDAANLVVQQGPDLHAMSACTSRSACPQSTTTTATTGIITGPPNEQMRGGVRLQTQTTSGIWPIQTTYTRSCTSGFAARRDSDGATVLLTAGHCFDQGPTVTHGDYNLGKVTTRAFGDKTGSNTDGEVIKLDDSSSAHWVPNNWVYADDSQTQQILRVFSRSETTGGTISAPMTKEGITTNQTFGQIQATGLTVTCRDCEGDGRDITFHNMTAASLCAEHGDSGGPVHWGYVGHGIMSLSNLDPATGHCRPSPVAYFNILSDIEAELGVHVFETAS
ncbi:MAG: trypsin-like serine protease [Actinobacteria bacterium]|nr:trypsin-like serine protease [Actinomycetota bacterium]